MKRLLTVAALAFSVATTTAFAQMSAPQAETPQAAQSRPHHRGNPHRMAQRMSRKLGLSADQTARLEPILADRQQKVQALHADTTLTDEQRHQGMKSIQQSVRMQMATVLTPDQMKQLKQMHHRQAQERAGRTQG